MKGIQSVADARTVVDAGTDAVVVSNHGGRQLDRAPTPLELLPPVVDAVGAGDAFVGGYLSELVAGGSVPACLRMGNALGAAVCQVPGDWEGLREQVTARLLARVDRVAPGFSDAVTDTFLQTPPDLERELGLRRGNVMHVEMSLPSMFGWRPLPELAGYRTPVAGLYLAGASTHPGGGVFGASGRAVAQVVLADS